MPIRNWSYTDARMAADEDLWPDLEQENRKQRIQRMHRHKAEQRQKELMKDRERRLFGKSG